MLRYTFHQQFNPVPVLFCKYSFANLEIVRVVIDIVILFDFSLSKPVESVSCPRSDETKEGRCRKVNKGNVYESEIASFRKKVQVRPV